jgi:hypothetical protein
MKTKLILIVTLLSAGLLTGTSVHARSGGGGGGGGPRGQGSGAQVNRDSGPRGNPNSQGAPLRDGSGKASAPGKGAKNGTGDRANCPNG